jgi:hypothetical protein
VSLANNNLPALDMIALPHDLFGNLGASTVLDKVNTVETQIADNDYALGLKPGDQPSPNLPSWFGVDFDCKLAQCYRGDRFFDRAIQRGNSVRRLFLA